MTWFFNRNGLVYTTRFCSDNICTEAFKHKDEEWWTDSVPCKVSWLDPSDFSLYSYLKDQIFCELRQSVPKFNKNNFQAMVSVSEETFQRVFKNLEIEFCSEFGKMRVIMKTY